MILFLFIKLVILKKLVNVGEVVVKIGIFNYC